MTTETRLKELRTWLINNMPQTPVEQRTRNFISEKDRKKLINKNLVQYKSRCRITKELVSRIAIKTSLTNDQVVRGTNTILEMIEKELTKGYKVIIEHFGEFSLKKQNNSGFDVTIVFKGTDLWIKSFNKALKKEEIGLFQTVKITKPRNFKKLK